MFERFTERSWQVILFAREEARALKHDYIGTEHLLLGVLREQEGLAARILASFGITVEGARAQIRQVATRVLLDFDADADDVRGELVGRLSS